MSSAIIIRTDDDTLIKRLAKKHNGVIVHDATSLGYKANRHYQSLFSSSDTPNDFFNEPSVEQCRVILGDMSPTMKLVLADLYPAKKPISLNGFNREIVTRDIEKVVETFNNRALKHGFVDHNQRPVEIITSRTSNTRSLSGNQQTRWRLAETARRAIELYKKSVIAN